MRMCMRDPVRVVGLRGESFPDRLALTSSFSLNASDTKGITNH
jgi:hypothetical protein